MDASHAVYSPRPFHPLSTPTKQHQSLTTNAAPPNEPPTSMFSIFSRAQPRFQPTPDDHPIVEVDEASGHNRRYSSVTGSPTGGRVKSNSLPRTDTRRRSSLQYSVGGTPSRISTKWERTPWFTLGFGWRPRRSQLRRFLFWCGALGLFLFCFSLVFILPSDLQRLAPVVIGALLSFISTLTIMVSFLLQPQNRRYPNELLVYVAICEFGLAVLALAHVMTYCSDNSYDCEPLGFKTCSITTALEMCLLLASVGWFGCAILHLFVSVSNPFANYKSQLMRYHVTVWGGSILLSVLVPLIVFSGASQTKYEMSGVEICRAVGLNLPLLPVATSDEDQQRRIAQWQTLNMEYWGTLFALVVLLVIAAQSILAVGWWRSNSGTVIALKARRRMMKRMTTYVHTLNATWLVILVVFFTYRSNPGALRHLAALSQATATATSASAYWTAGSLTGTSDVEMNLLDAFFHFILAAKGYFTCVVWLAVNKHCCAIGRPLLCKTGGSLHYQSSEEEDDEDDDSDRETAHHVSGSAAMLGAPPDRMSTTLSTSSQVRQSSVHLMSFSAGEGARRPYSSANSFSSSSAAFASQNNETLQREIIYYTVCGISKSILKSANTADADVFFQQLLVGADRESLASMAGHHHNYSHRHSLNQSAYPTHEALHSPRAYCMPTWNHSLSSTGGLSSSQGPTASFTASTSSFRRVANSSGISLRDLALSVSGDDAQSSFSASFGSNTSASTATRPLPPPPPPPHPPQRYSMYPVSHVPFELFEQEIELQSQRSSEGSLSLSPLFANLRRTAQSFTNASTAKTLNTTTGVVENPRPKLFIDYAPTEFRAIRKAFGLSDEHYLASFRSTAKERVSAGSSGAFMFFSGDNALIVKSMKEKECRKLVKMIPAYADYITSHPASRIIRFFGCHRIRLYGRNFYFVVMSNVLHSPAHTPTITEKYDVKGSWIDRQARRPQLGDRVVCSECNATYEFGRGDASTTFPFHVHRADTILKDLDLKRPLLMGKRVATALYEQLEMDCEFLHSMGIMDYSLLVGVHKCSHEEQPWQREFRMSMSFLKTGGDLRQESDGSDLASCGTHLEPIPEEGDYPEEVYFVGIIDILQEWNWEKQLEKVGKTLIGKSSGGISAVEPHAYCERFKARVAQILRLHEDDNYCDTKVLVKQPSMHPVSSAEQLAFEFSDESVRDSTSSVDESADVSVVRSSQLSMDEALRFDAEAIAVSMDLEGGRVSQRL